MHQHDRHAWRAATSRQLTQLLNGVRLLTVRVADAPNGGTVSHSRFHVDPAPRFERDEDPSYAFSRRSVSYG